MAERKITAEEYNALKNQERAEAYELLSAGTQKLLSGDELKSYAEMQAKLFNFSASNVMPGVSGTRSAGQGKTTSAVVLHGTVNFHVSPSSFRSHADSILPYDER